MATYTNTISITDLSYNDVSNNFWSITLSSNTGAYTEIQKNEIITDSSNNQGQVSYFSINDEGIN